MRCNGRATIITFSPRFSCSVRFAFQMRKQRSGIASGISDFPTNAPYKGVSLTAFLGSFRKVKKPMRQVAKS